ENKQPEGEPCGHCTSCQRIWSGSSSLDVVEIDAASNRGVDDARDLRERAMYAPSGDDRYKVYIVDEAHMLTREAWNALLKILEEPPPRVVFVFATTEPQRIAQAAAPVLSRLQRFDLKRIGVGDITARLETILAEEAITASPAALAMIARAADGSMRDALSLTDQVISIGEGGVSSERVRAALGLLPEDEYVAVLDLVATRRAGDVFALVRRLADGGIDFGVFLAGLADMLRAQLAVLLNGSTDGITPDAHASLEAHRQDFSAGDLLRMLSMLSAMETQFRRSSQQQLLVEMLLVRFALLDRSVLLEAVIQGLAGNESGATGRPPAKPGPRGPRAEARPAPSRWPDKREAAAPAPDGPVVQPAPPDRAPPLAADDPRAAAASVAGPVPSNQPEPPPRGGWKQGFAQTASAAAGPRLTTESVIAERLQMLRAQDPVLDAAIDALDLELLD
ncbi:MAG: DNA polymerase III subunit gamma/tau, partial [Gemmatimonadaceae bacterium]